MTAGQGPKVLPDLSIHRSTTGDRVTAALREAMFSGALPPGARLREVELAAAMKVSRGSVREALLVLHGEGLVVRSSFRSVEVRQLRRAEIHDLFLTRGLIERCAVERFRSATSTARAELEAAVIEFVAAVESGPSAQHNTADLQVHRALVKTLDSPRLSSIHDGLIAELRVALAAEYLAADAVPTHALIDRHIRFMELMHAGEFHAARLQLNERLAAAETRLILASERADDRTR